MRSIGARLGISLFVSLLLAGVLVGQGALWWLEREQRRISAGQLRDEAASVLAASAMLRREQRFYISRIEILYIEIFRPTIQNGGKTIQNGGKSIPLLGLG